MRIQLQERVNELQEVRAATPASPQPCFPAAPLSPSPAPPIISHIDIVPPFPLGCRRPKRLMPAKRSWP